jgi:hypothetical protein
MKIRISLIQQTTIIDLFQQYIAESSTVLTCYEDSLGRTDKSFYFAEYACNYTREMWDSGNFSAPSD